LAALVIAAVALSIAMPLIMQPALSERDLRLRTHAGALGRFYLDALLGLTPIRLHRAERSVTTEFKGLLEHWAEAGLARQRLVVLLQGIQFGVGFGFASWLLLSNFRLAGHTGETLLLVYWTLSLPVTGQDLAQLIWQYPIHRNTTLRMLEALGARDQHTGVKSGEAEAVVQTSSGVAIRLENVNVEASGHAVLRDLEISIEAGSHVAIVGQSGAGKSSFVGLLLGWHRPVTGKVLVDDAELDGRSIERLRRETAWVDPSVQLWNRTLLENLRYGAVPDSAAL